jgi:putative oxidoreductase
MGSGFVSFTKSFLKFLNLCSICGISYIDVDTIDVDVMAPAEGGIETMKTTSTVARYLLGFVFLLFGLNGLFPFLPMPAPTGVAAQFLGALIASHYLVVIFLAQIIPATMLLINRYVPLALVMLAPVIVNILTFHVFMAPSGLPLALFVTVLWLLTYWAVRPAFASLLERRVEEKHA